MTAEKMPDQEVAIDLHATIAIRLDTMKANAGKSCTKEKHATIAARKGTLKRSA